MESDSFFRTLANLVSEALDHEAPLCLPTSDHPIVAAAMAFTKEHLDSVSADEVSPRGVGVRAHAAAPVPGHARIVLADLSFARANASGDGAAGRAGSVGTGDRVGRRLRQPQLIHARVHPVLRRDTQRPTAKGLQARGFEPAYAPSSRGCGNSPSRSSVLTDVLPPVELLGRGEGVRDLPLDMGAHDESAQRQDKRIQRRPGHVDVVAQLRRSLFAGPSGRAEGRERVQDRDTQRAAVDERATEVVHDLGMLEDEVW